MKTSSMKYFDAHKEESWVENKTSMENEKEKNVSGIFNSTKVITYVRLVGHYVPIWRWWCSLLLIWNWFFLLRLKPPDDSETANEPRIQENSYRLSMIFQWHPRINPKWWMLFRIWFKDDGFNRIEVWTVNNLVDGGSNFQWTILKCRIQLIIRESN